MASTNTLAVLSPWDGSPFTVGGPQLQTVSRVATPYYIYRIASFDDTTTEYLDFMCVMPNHYDGGGVTCTIVFTHDSVSAGPTWGIGFRRMEDDIDNMTLYHAYDYNTVASAVLSVSGEIGYEDITFTNGADMDFVTVGDFFVTRIYRDPATGGTGDANLISIRIKET